MESSNRKIYLKKIHTIAQWILIFFVVLLPFQTRFIALPGSLNGGPWEYGTVSMYATDLLLLALVVLGLILRKKQKQVSNSNILALVLLLVAFVSLGLAINRINGLFWYAQLLKGVLLFFSIQWIKPRPRVIAYAWLVSGLIQSVLVHVQFFTQHVFASKWLGMSAQDPATLGVTVIESEGQRWLRAYGSLPHPNIAGIFLVIALIVAIGLFARATSLRARIVFGLSILVTSSALWLTFSRQSWIALVLMCVVLVAHVFWSERRFPVLATVAVLLALLPSIVWTAIHPDLTTTRFSGTQRLEQQSITDRQERLQESVPLIRDHWLSGVGIGNYTAVLQARDRDNSIIRSSYVYQPVHNVYVLVLAELGIAGLFVLLLFLISIFLPRKKKSSDWAIIWKLSLLGILLTGLFDHYWWSLAVGITLFWLIAGLTQQKD